MTFLACSLGVLALPSSQACNLATESSCAIAGGSTKTLIRVAGLMLPNAKTAPPELGNPEDSRFIERGSETVTVCVTSAPSVNETRQVLDTLEAHFIEGEELVKAQ